MSSSSHRTNHVCLLLCLLLRTAALLGPIGLAILCLAGCGGSSSSGDQKAASSTPQGPADTPAAPEQTAPAGGRHSPAASAAEASADLAPAASATATASAKPALGKEDPQEAKRIADEYGKLRRLLSAPADGDEMAMIKVGRKDLALLRTYAGKNKVNAVLSEGVDEESHSIPLNAVRSIWLEHLVADAKRGILSVLRIPLTLCVGWGSVTPSDYVAMGCFEPGAFFVVPAGDTELIEKCSGCYDLAEERIDSCKEQRCSLLVEGYFTGNEVKARNSPHPPGAEFFITKARVSREQAGAFTLRLPGGSPAPDGPLLADGARWGVMFANFFLTDDKAKDKAEALRSELARRKLANAEVIDSRRISTLWCCSYVVLADRADTKEAAESRAQELKRQGFDDVMVRELYQAASP